MQSLKKFTSRKFIATVLAVISGFITLIIGDSNYISAIIAGLEIVIPVVIYCIIEGRIDAKSVQTLTEVTSQTVKDLGSTEKISDIIKSIGNLAEEIVKDNNANKE